MTVGRSGQMVVVSCPDCGVIQCVQAASVRRRKHTGRCRSCARSRVWAAKRGRRPFVTDYRGVKVPAVLIYCPDCDRPRLVRAGEISRGKIQPLCRICRTPVIWDRFTRCPAGYMRVNLTRPDGRTLTLYEHVLLMEQHLGRGMYAWERVHHKDTIRSHNWLGNFEVLHVHNHSPGGSQGDLISEIQRLRERVSELELVAA